MLGPDLRTLRERYGMTQPQLCRILGLKSFSQVSHWENDLYPIPAKWQVRLAVLFKDLARRRPPTQICPFCQGVGMIQPPLGMTVKVPAKEEPS